MVKRVLVAVLMMCPAVVLAQAPQLLGYQGRLVKTDGTPESGNAQMRFGLFGTETGGSSLWEETQAVSITQGYYSTYLGRMTTFPATLFDTGTLWLEVAVQAPGDTQFRTMTPRQRVGSVAFALNARSVKGGTVDATSVSINGTQVIDSNGKLTASAGYSAGPGISIDGTTRAISVNSSGCSTGQVLQWNGSAWQCATVSGSGGGISGVSGTAPITVMNGTTSPVVSVSVGTTAGTVAAGNDTRFGNATSIGGVPVASSAPTTGQVLAYNGMTWNPTSVATGGVASVTAGTGLTGGTITTTGTIAIADGGVGTAQLANGAVTFDKLSSAGCAANQVLRFNGTTWACAAAAAGGSSAPGLIASFDFEDSASPFLDTSGLANNAAFTTGLNAGALGHTGTGANFAGGVALVANGNSIPDSPQVHVEAWIRPTLSAAAESDVIVGKQGAWSLRYVTGAGVSDIEFRVTTRAAAPNCSVQTTGANISAATFTHVQGFYDGLLIGVVINGNVAVQAACAKGPLAANAGTALTLGGPTTVGERYLGFLDSVRVRSFAQMPGNRFFQATYTHWGSSTCAPGDQLVYAGIAFTNHHTHAGSGPILCLPRSGTPNGVASQYDGEYLYAATIQGGATVHTGAIQNDKKIACALCLAPRTACFELAGLGTCPAPYTSVYSGYYYGGHSGHGRAPRLCVESVNTDNSFPNTPDTGAYLYPTKVQATGGTPVPANTYVRCNVCCL